MQTTLGFNTLKKVKKRNIMLRYENEIESEILKEPLFRKIWALKKILNKFNNKTFTLPQEDEENDLIIQIKLEICKIINRILDTREEYLIDNFLEFFRDKFLQRAQSIGDKIYEIDWDKDFLSLLPNTTECVTN